MTAIVRRRWACIEKEMSIVKNDVALQLIDPGDQLPVRLFGNAPQESQKTADFATPVDAMFQSVKRYLLRDGHSFALQ